jgi:arylformamidase
MHMKQIGKSFIELSHEIDHGMITYRGLPGPVIKDHLSREESKSHYSEGVEFYIGKIEMVANTGTYVDVPFHRYPDGAGFCEIPLSSLANLDGIVVHFNHEKGRTIEASLFHHLSLKGKAVLVHTGWDVHWRTEQYFEGHPYLTSDAARYLIQAGAALVGIDSLNIDDTRDLARPAHSLLLGAGIPIVEHLCNLQSLRAENFRFFAVPPPIRGLGSFPVRAFALTE